MWLVEDPSTDAGHPPYSGTVSLTLRNLRGCCMGGVSLRIGGMGGKLAEASDASGLGFQIRCSQCINHAHKAKGGTKQPASHALLPHSAG